MNATNETKYATASDCRNFKAAKAFAHFSLIHNRIASLALTANVLACLGFLPAHIDQCLAIL